MNIEIEVKVQVKNLDLVREKIEKISSFVKKVKQVDTYYTPTHRDFFANDPVIEFFRIRSEDDKTELAYHNRKDIGKESEYSAEYEVKFDDKNTMKEILNALNFIERFVVSKHREYYHCGDFEIVLDLVDNLGSFVEVEVKNGESGITRKDCLNFLRANEIIFEEEINYGYPELMMMKENI